MQNWIENWNWIFKGGLLGGCLCWQIMKFDTPCLMLFFSRVVVDAPQHIFGKVFPLREQQKTAMKCSSGRSRSRRVASVNFEKGLASDFWGSGMVSGLGPSNKFSCLPKHKPLASNTNSSNPKAKATNHWNNICHAIGFSGSVLGFGLAHCFDFCFGPALPEFIRIEIDIESVKSNIVLISIWSP